jgi:hypothetical protein
VPIEGALGPVRMVSLSEGDRQQLKRKRDL